MFDIILKALGYLKWHILILTEVSGVLDLLRIEALSVFKSMFLQAQTTGIIDYPIF